MMIYLFSNIDSNFNMDVYHYFYSGTNNIIYKYSKQKKNWYYSNMDYLFFVYPPKKLVPEKIDFDILDICYEKIITRIDEQNCVDKYMLLKILNSI